jgi:hypothetical protein
MVNDKGNHAHPTSVQLSICSRLSVEGTGVPRPTGSQTTFRSDGGLDQQTSEFK